MATGGGDDDEKELEIVMDKDLREEEEGEGGEVKRTRVKRRSPAVVKGMRKGDRSAWPRFCQYARGCLNFPLYGEYWDKMPRFCIEHRHDHHINVRGAGKNKYMGLAVNGSRVIDVRNIAVVEDPSNPEDAERLRKCFEPYHDCVLCGAKGWVDWYYDFPIYAKRLCIRDIMNFISLEQTGRPCMSPPPELYDELWKNVPPGPFATEGDEEWKRFEGTQEGLDARTNKDVREAEQIKRMWEEECKIAAAETPEQRKAYVDEFLKRSRENQRAIDVASKGDASAPSSQDPDAPPRLPVSLPIPLSLSPSLPLSLPPFLSPSLPPSLSLFPSFPLSLSPSLSPLSRSPALPLSLSPSIPLSLSPSLPLLLPLSLLLWLFLSCPHPLSPSLPPPACRTRGGTGHWHWVSSGSACQMPLGTSQCVLVANCS